MRNQQTNGGLVPIIMERLTVELSQLINETKGVMSLHGTTAYP